MLSFVQLGDVVWQIACTLQLIESLNRDYESKIEVCLPYNTFCHSLLFSNTKDISQDFLQVIHGGVGHQILQPRPIGFYYSCKFDTRKIILKKRR